jgi:hypothetical protein
MLRAITLQKALLIGLLTLLLTSQASTASTGTNVWTSNGPEGGTILALAIDPATPATLYAGTGGGVFKSTNGGGNWSAVNTGLTAAGVSALAIDPATPATLYAGTGGGVFKSTNGGGNWSAVNAGLTSTFVRALAIDPATPATLYAGTNGGGVFKSTNGGGNWSAANTGLTNTDVRALAIDPATPATLYAGTNGGGVFKSTNGGGNWSAFNTGLTNTDVRALAIDPTTPATLYAGTFGGGVFSIHQVPPSPTLTLNYTNGSPGSFFTITGEDYPANSQATVSLNGTTLTNTLPVDETGQFTVILDTEGADVGYYNLTISVNTSVTATVSFLLDSAAPLRPQEGDGIIIVVPPGTAWQQLFLPVIMQRAVTP